MTQPSEKDSLRPGARSPLVVEVRPGRHAAEPVERDPSRPLVYVDDLGYTHGDGCFETMLMHAGEVVDRAEHWQRWHNSRRLLDIEAEWMDRSAWDAALDFVERRWSRGAADGPPAGAGQGVGEPEDPRVVLPGDASVRIQITRGRVGLGGAGAAKVFITVTAVAKRVSEARIHGVSAISVRGWEPEPGSVTEVWSAKSLSLAMYDAALRWAAARGAQEALLVDARGNVLDGARNAVVIAAAGRLITPPGKPGVLPGTTIARIEAGARRSGQESVRAPIGLEDLRRADACWLVSSVTLIAPLRVLDGRELARRTAPDLWKLWKLGESVQTRAGGAGEV